MAVLRNIIGVQIPLMVITLMLVNIGKLLP
jgi:hypothetical protein